MADSRVDVIISAKDNASRTIKGVGNSLDSLKSGASSLAKGLMKFGAIAGTAFAVAGGFAVKSASDFEQSRIAFDTMLGSADKARKMMSDIAKFAKATPFELPELVEGSKRLLAYGIEAEKIIPTMEILGNISAGVGKDKLPFLITALGQVRAKTILSGEELKQFTETGVPLIAELAKVTGYSIGEITDGTKDLKISYDSVFKALAGMATGHGKFAGLMIKQSKTLGGIWSNLMDTFGELGRRILGMENNGDIRKGSIFYYLRIGAGNFYDYISSKTDTFVKVTQDLIAWVINTKNRIAQLRDSIVQWYKSSAVAQGIVAYLKVLLEQMVNVWKSLWQQIMANKEAWITLGKGALVIVATAVAVLIASITVLGYVLKGVIWVITQVAKWLQNTYNKIKANIIAVAQFAIGFKIGVNLAVSYVKYLWDRVKYYIDRIKSKMSEVGNAIASPIRSGWNWLTGRQSGGQVYAGQPYMVGEAGTEMFVPRGSGRIVPNNKLGGGSQISINIYGNINNDKGMSVDQISKTIGRQIELAMQGAR